MLADRQTHRQTNMLITIHCSPTGDGERKKIIHHKANNRCDNQNKLMWQAAREEIPI